VFKEDYRLHPGALKLCCSLYVNNARESSHHPFILGRFVFLVQIDGKQ